jgi:hypothetical protein
MAEHAHSLATEDYAVLKLAAFHGAQHAANGLTALVEVIRYEHQEGKNMVSQAESLGHRIVEESGAGKSRNTEPSGG